MDLWGGGATRAVSSTLAPDGVSFATLATSVATSYGGFVRSLSTYSAAVGQAVTVSCWVKKGNHRYVAVIHDSIRTSGNIQPFFDLDTLTFNANGVGTFTHSIVSYPNGWYRLSISGTSISTTSFSVDVWMVDSNGNAQNSLGSSQTVLWWGAQLEVGSFPTSYIPTTTGSVVRSADVCNITGGDFTGFYNQSEGTLFADVSGLMTGALGGNRGIAVITDGTYANKFEIVKSANVGNIRAEGRTGSVDQFSFSNNYAPFTQYKVALGVKTNDTNAAFNGSLQITDTSVTLPSTMNRLEFRDATGGVGGQPSCHLAAIRYYKKRLPNAKLQALTV
jgi:hypothetical protein